jgi:hypothetical protein
VVHEDVISGRALDESIALRVVEPLHDTLFSVHIVSVFLCSFEISSFRSRDRSPKTKKGHKINDFAAFDDRGIRSQKLIKLI